MVKKENDDSPPQAESPPAIATPIAATAATNATSPPILEKMETESVAK